MKKCKLYALLVIYNKYIWETKPFKILNLYSSKNSDLEIVVFDNSNDKFRKRNIRFSCNKHLRYISENKNAGLSKAYNSAVKLINNYSRNNVLLLLDDDTQITVNFLKELDRSINNTDYDLYMPIVTGQDGVKYSPNEKGLLRGHFFDDPQKVRKDKINGINSCLAIRMNIFNRFSYNEDLFVDCVDDFFFDFVRKNKLKPMILNAYIKQEFSQRGENMNADKMMNRLLIRIKDNITYYKVIHHPFLGLIKCLGWSFIYGMKFHSLKFIGVCSSTAMVNCYLNKEGKN